jgi:hypothetical protein
MRGMRGRVLLGGAVSGTGDGEIRDSRVCGGFGESRMMGCLLVVSNCYKISGECAIVAYLTCRCL